MPGVSVTIITLNEGANIDDCLASVAWADDVVVVDSHSTDDTVERAKAHGARVIVRDWPGYADQKNLAAEARHDWILSVDADERVTPALAAEITSAVASASDTVGYRIPRLTWHLGRWIRKEPTGTRITSSVCTIAAEPRGRRVSSTNPYRATGRVVYLTNDLQHYAYRDISHHHEVMNRYTTLAARQMHEQGRRASVDDVVLHPAAAFLRNYVLKRGFFDGLPGFIISVMNAQYVFLKFAKLWEMQKRPRS